MLLPLRRLIHSLDNHGWAGTMRRVLGRKPVGDPDPMEFSDPVAPHPFDLRYGTDTGGYLAGESLCSGMAKADFYNTAYYGVSPSTLSAALFHFSEEPQGFTFVDLGCGKGRALLIAARHGFGNVLGVELSADLCVIARRNLSASVNATVLQGNAAKVEYPNRPLLVYLYHPFLAPLLRSVVRNLQRQLTAVPRTCYLLQANPTYPELLAKHGAVPVWHKALALSQEDADADRHGITQERYSLWRLGA